MRPSHYILSLLLISGSVLRPHAAVILNGGFESGDVGSNDTSVILWNGTLQDPPGLTSWSVGHAGDTTQIHLNKGTPSGLGLAPYAGSQYLSFDVGNTANLGFISQEITTVASQQYTVSYAVGRAGEGGGSNEVSMNIAATAGENPISDQTTTRNSLGWTLATFTFTAISGTTTLTFTDYSNEANYDVALDAVSIAAVPEPSAYATVVGFVLGAFACRRGITLRQTLLRRRPRGEAMGPHLHI